MKFKASQNGFSFIELIMVVSILSFISLGIAQVFSSLYNEGRILTLKQNSQSVITELRTILSDKNSCTSALIKGGTFDESKAAVKVDSKTTDYINAGQKLSINMIGASEVLQANSIIESYGIKVNFVNFTDAELMGVESDGSKLYRGRIWMGLAKAYDKDPGPSAYKPELVGGAYLTTSGSDSLEECFSINDNPERSVASMIEEMCGSFNGNYDKSTNKCDVGGGGGSDGGSRGPCSGSPPNRGNLWSCFCTSNGWNCVRESK